MNTTAATAPATLAVGDGLTQHYPQDTYGWVVVRVSASGKTAHAVRLPAPADLGHPVTRFDGPYPVWAHTYTRAELDAAVWAYYASRAGEVRRLSLRRDGRWAFSGDDTRLVTGRAGYYRNLSR